MKLLVQIIRIIVGLLFVFSGLVKANDPMGLSYKMQEFFEVWGLHGFNGWTLTMSVMMNAFEIIAGVALLIGWRIKLVIWLLLLLIFAFTFLTGYTYITGQPKNCGCFGDCLPISAKTSFLKDVVLLLMIVFLLWRKDWIKPLFNRKASLLVMALITLSSFAFQWYTLKYLPVVDCLPFKVGNNIADKMKMPADAVPDSTVITFVYQKDGKEVSFTADKFPADFSKDTYTYVKRFDKVVKEGKNNKVLISGFSLKQAPNGEADVTQTVLEQPFAAIIFLEKADDYSDSWNKKAESIYNAAKAKNITTVIITTQPNALLQKMKASKIPATAIVSCDEKPIQMAARTESVLLLLNKGTIIKKYSSLNFSKAVNAIEEIAVQDEKFYKMMEPAIISPADSSGRFLNNDNPDDDSTGTNANQ